MVLVIDVPALARLLRTIGVERFLIELAERIERDYAAWHRFEKQARMASHTPTGVLELMPVADGEWFSFKLVNGHPGNPARGLLTVTAVGMLAEVETGYPRLISEMTALTALRTAATSALAARHLASAGARTMALIGTGAQSEFQALAFKACVGVRSLRCFDPDPAALRKFVANLRDFDIEPVACSGVADAVQGAQIITTATAAKGRHVVLEDRWIADGVHVNAIGGDCPGKTEIDATTLRRARIVVEFLPQTRIEGDIQSLGPQAHAIELWQIVCGREPGRLDANQVTVFDSVGFALEDYSALRYVYDRARALGIGRHIALLPQPGDPKDLFGYIMRRGD
jgi:ornithine cyclodeaminase